MKKLLALVLAGVAVKYLLDSEKGKELQSQVKDWLGEAQSAMKGAVDKTRSSVDQAMPGANG